MFFMILIDTNMLLVPGQFNVDIIKQAKKTDKNLAVLESTIEELKIISNSGKKDAGSAKVGLELIKKNNIEILKQKTGNSVDEKVLNCAKENNYKVATNDKELISKLKENNIKVIRLRQKKYLVED